MNKMFFRNYTAVLILLIINGTAFGVTCNTGDLGGVIFRDYNQNGQQDFLEPGFGVSGMRVDAFVAGSHIPVATVNVNADGTYLFSGLAVADYRLEFKGLPDFLQYGASGLNSDSGVRFVKATNCKIDFGVNNPADYCQNNPDLATACYVDGPQTIHNDVMVTFPYNAGFPGNANINSPPHNTLAFADEIGTTYGIAWQKSTATLYAASFLKRFAGFGPGGPDAIYKIAPGGISRIDLDIFLGPNSAGADPHPDGTTNWQRDDSASALIGKMSFGDMEISFDEKMLYVVNLFNKTLVKIPTTIFPPQSFGTVSTVKIPNLSCANNNNFRPSALKIRDNRLYVGGVCSAETSGNTNDLRAFVYRFNPATNNFVSVLDIALNYPRKCVDVATFADCNLWAPGAWNPWIPGAWPTSFPPKSQKLWPAYPQPWFADIEFDYNGDMILGFRDRFGDQTGTAKQADPSDPKTTNISGVMGGDNLRACVNNTGGWDLEQNGLCGGVQTNPPAFVGPTGSGPGNPGQEYYWDEFYARSDQGTGIEPWHSELSLGGLVQIPGKADVAMTAYDLDLPPTLNILDGGVIWLNNKTGARTHTYRVFDGEIPQTPALTFGKSNGLGELEALCNASPLEIGNRVWNDLNANGIQEPGEPGMPGVTVILSCGANSAAVTTDGNGRYLFNSANTLINLSFMQPGTTCSLAIANTDPNLNGLHITAVNADGITSNDAQIDVRDSDASTVAGQAVIASFILGAAGHNNHSYDFGYTNLPVVDPFAPPKAVPFLNAWMLFTTSVLLALMGISISRRSKKSGV